MNRKLKQRIETLENENYKLVNRIKTLENDMMIRKIERAITSLSKEYNIELEITGYYKQLFTFLKLYALVLKVDDKEYKFALDKSLEEMVDYVNSEEVVNAIKSYLYDRAENKEGDSN